MDGAPSQYFVEEILSRAAFATLLPSHIPVSCPRYRYIILQIPWYVRYIHCNQYRYRHRLVARSMMLWNLRAPRASTPSSRLLPLVAMHHGKLQTSSKLMYGKTLMASVRPRWSQLTNMCSLIQNKKIECTECGQPCLEYKGDRGRLVACNCNCDMVLETTRRMRQCVDQETAGGGVGGMRRGMGELDRTGQGMLETYRIHAQARPDSCTGLVFQLAVAQRGMCLHTHTVHSTQHIWARVFICSC